MIEIAHVPKCGPLVEVTLVRWTRPLPYDEADELAKSLDGEESLLPSAQIHDLKEEISALENELADEKKRWRERMHKVVELARAMIDNAKSTTEIRFTKGNQLDGAFRW